MDTLIQIGIALAVVAAVVGFSWWIAGMQVNREFGRRERAEKAAAKIRNLIFATRTSFRDSEKRMPLSLDTLLDDSWQTYARLSDRSWWVRNEAGVTTIVTEADKVIAAINAAIEHVPTIEELDADAAALGEQLEQAQRDHAEAVAQADRDLKAAIADADGALTSARARVAKELDQIKAEKASRQ